MIKILNFIIIVLFISCNREPKKNKHIDIEKPDNTDVILNLPDNIYMNEIIQDTVYYKSPLDTISLSKNDKRFIIFYTTIDTIKYKSVKEIESREHQMFIEKEKGIIPFSIEFDRPGDNYFTGIIEDQIILDNFQDGKSRIITHENVVTVRLWVKEPKKQTM